MLVFFWWKRYIYLGM